MRPLDKANQYIETVKSSVNPMYRPAYHYTSEAGWINDPNGFSRFNGEYHLFAQHYPYDSKWGPMHWSHAKSDDLIKWTHLPIALAPDKEYELDLGCFSGTALEHEGKHILMYTSCQGKVGEPVEQLQCVAIGDGVTYEKLEANPVITGKDLPAFAKTSDFRDPKIFRRDGFFYALIGAQVIEHRIGTMLLYKSENLTDWTYVGETLRAPLDGSMGIVFECPDLFRVGDKDVIITSPIEMDAVGHRYRNISSALYFVGEMNVETGQFTVDYFDELDGGFDFYAPQTTTSEVGDTILIAWAQMWERNFITDQLNHGWCGAMSLPRRLSLKGKRLVQEPIKALESYHGEETSNLEALSQRAYRLKVSIDLSSGSQFELELLKTSAGAFKISYDVNTQTLGIDRSQSMFKLDRHHRESGVDNKRAIILPEAKQLDLDIIVDHSLVEIFVNQGEYTLTSNYYVGQTTVTSQLTTDHVVTMKKWEFKK